MKKKLFFIMHILIMNILVAMYLPAFAASAKATISYEPSSPNFSMNQQNVVTVVIKPASGVVSAVTLTFQTTGGVKLVNVLDALDGSNTLLTNSKYIRQDVSDKSAKITILIMKATVDLPSIIKIPVVVSGTKAGNLQIDTKESQVTDGNGNTYTFSQSKVGYITFSQTGKDTLLPPTPTPLPATSMNVAVTMKFQGITSSGVKSKTISGVKVQLVQGSGQAAQYSLPQYITVTMDEAGLWHGNAVFPNVKKGADYAILIKGPKHLQKRICENDATELAPGKYACTERKINLNTSTSVLDTSGVMEMIGDIGIQDSILNSYDLSFIQNTIRKTAKNSLSDADVNYDGKVDKTDYELLVYTLVNTSGQDQK